MRLCDAETLLTHLAKQLRLNPQLEPKVIVPLTALLRESRDYVRLEAALALGEVVRAQPKLSEQAIQELRKLLARE